LDFLFLRIIITDPAITATAIKTAAMRRKGEETETGRLFVRFQKLYFPMSNLYGNCYRKESLVINLSENSEVTY